MHGLSSWQLKSKVLSCLLGHLLELQVLHRIGSIQAVQWVQVLQANLACLVFQVLLVLLEYLVLQYQVVQINLWDLLGQGDPCYQFLVCQDLQHNLYHPWVQLVLELQAYLVDQGSLFVQFLLECQGHQLALWVLPFLLVLYNLYQVYLEGLVVQQSIQTIDLAI